MIISETVWRIAGAVITKLIIGEILTGGGQGQAYRIWAGKGGKPAISTGTPRRNPAIRDSKTRCARWHLPQSRTGLGGKQTGGSHNTAGSTAAAQHTGAEHQLERPGKSAPDQRRFASVWQAASYSALLKPVTLTPSQPLSASGI